MKGLIRNNFYSVRSALKWTIAFCIVVNFAVIIGAGKITINNTILTILIVGQIINFTGLAGTALEKDNTSKWSKYERTLPVKIRDITRARYMSFIIFSAIGISFATLTVVLLSVFSAQPMNMERVGYGYSFGITYSLLVPALLYPLVLKFGADKVNTILLTSTLITVFLFNSSSAILKPYFININNANMIYRIGWITISAIMFMSSYFISISIYKRKEF
ncbi:ABC-2 transporter permease [Paraclostridium sordellii]|uniref:ABC-2 transporter permease n=1 Tax=Paraclostridium sordellii TaxID=1505 RepID=UPI0005DDEFAE|nr:ABC-2 transporter permease [Paeniclostridium sordellii]CEP80525.1 membrane protein [[Clostridium] sordellii] [Paeniclostridium sordellii]